MTILDTHTHLIALLNRYQARYMLLKHQGEGRSQEVSKIRGTDPSQAMKAIVLAVRGGGNDRRYIMAVIPGNRRLDMKALLAHVGAQKGRFATLGEVNYLTDCVSGAIPLFTFRKELILIPDEHFRSLDEVAFNAGRLDRSIIMNFEDYVSIPRATFTSLSYIE